MGEHYLDDEVIESRKLLVNLARVYHLYLAKLNKDLKTFDLTESQFNVLRVLREHAPNAVNLRDITSRMINPQSNSTRIVDRLIRKDWVTRETCEDNKRKVNICITSSGLETLEKVDVLEVKLLKKFASILPEAQRDQMIFNLKKILGKETNLKAH